MIDEREKLLDALIEQGEALRSAALRADWDATMDEQERFRASAEAFFAEPVPAEDSERVAGALRDLLALNDSVSRLVQGRRLALARRLVSVNTGRQAVEAYGQGAR